MNAKRKFQDSDNSANWMIGKSTRNGKPTLETVVKATLHAIGVFSGHHTVGTMETPK
jgi:hypothetical protein